MTQEIILSLALYFDRFVQYIGLWIGIIALIGIPLLIWHKMRYGNK